MTERRYMVAQLGARMHYAVPRILQEAGRLERFYTDFSANRGLPALLSLIPPPFRPAAVRRLMGRQAQGVPAAKTAAFNALGWEYARRLRRSQSPTETTQTFLWSGREFCRRVLEKGFGPANAIYTFNSAGLEILEQAGEQGLHTVMEQTIAPKRLEIQLLAEEAERFPDWERGRKEDAAAGGYMEREEAEWARANVILCGSEFVREGIARCGGPAERCVVVPYGVDVIGNAECGVRNSETTKGEDPELEVQNRPLRVLTVGWVGLRKGSPYVLAAARQLRGKAEVRMVGGLGITPAAEAALREQVDLMGPVPRSEVERHFEWADVFLLPSLCEGSATVTYEAMAHGLPVICTPNTGSVVRDGLDGFIVPARDVTAIADRLEHLANDEALRERMSAHARGRAKDFTLSAYGERLLTALDCKPVKKLTN